MANGEQDREITGLPVALELGTNDRIPLYDAETGNPQALTGASLDAIIEAKLAALAGETEGGLNAAQVRALIGPLFRAGAANPAGSNVLGNINGGAVMWAGLDNDQISDDAITGRKIREDTITDRELSMAVEARLLPDPSGQSDGRILSVASGAWALADAPTGGGGGQSAAQVSAQIRDESVGVVDSLPLSGYATGDAIYSTQERRIYDVSSIQGAQAFTITAGTPGGGDDRVGYWPGSFGSSDDAPAWVSRLYWDDSDQRLKLRIRALSNPVRVSVRWGTHGTANLAGALAGGFWSGSAPFTSPPTGAQPITLTPNTAFGAWVPAAAGAQGERGEKGDKGDPGDPGAAGARGPQGLPGSDATVTRTAVYTQAKLIMTAGANITITPDDAAMTLTVAGQAGGGGGVSQSEATAIAHAAVTAGVADWAETNNRARIPEAKMSTRAAEIDGYIEEGGWSNLPAVQVAQTTWAAAPTQAQLTGAAYASTYQAPSMLDDVYVGIRVPAAQAGADLRAAVTADVSGVTQVYERHDRDEWTLVASTGGYAYYSRLFSDAGLGETIRAQSHSDTRWNPARVKRAAEDVSVDASGFDGNLSSTDTNLQLVARRLDDLVVSGGGGGGEGMPFLTQIGDETIVQRGARWQFQAPLTASPVIPDDVDFFVIEITGERSGPTAQWDHCSIFVFAEGATFRNLPASVGGTTSINGRAAGVDGTAAFGNYRFLNQTPQQIWGDRVSYGRTATNGLVFASNDAGADTDQQLRFKVFRSNDVGGGAAAQPSASASLPVAPEDDERVLLTAPDVWRQDYAITWNAEATNLLASATPAGAEAVRWYSADSGNPAALRSRIVVQDSTTDGRTPAAIWIDGVRRPVSRASVALQHFYRAAATVPAPSAGDADRINIEYSDGSFSRSQDVSAGLVQFDEGADSWAHVPGQWTLPQIRAEIAEWARSGQPAPVAVLQDALLPLNVTDTDTNHLGNWTRFTTNLVLPTDGQGVLAFDLYFNNFATSAVVAQVEDADRLAASAVSLGRLRGLTANTGAVIVGLLPVRNASGQEVGRMAIQVRRTAAHNVEFRTNYTSGTVASTGGNFSGNAWLTVSLTRSV